MASNCNLQSDLSPASLEKPLFEGASLIQGLLPLALQLRPLGAQLSPLLPLLHIEVKLLLRRLKLQTTHPGHHLLLPWPSLEPQNHSTPTASYLSNCLDVIRQDSPATDRYAHSTERGCWLLQTPPAMPYAHSRCQPMASSSCRKSCSSCDRLMAPCFGSLTPHAMAR